MKKSKSRLPWASACGAVAVGLLGYACATPLVPEDVKLRPNAMSASSPASRSATVGTTIQNEPRVTVRDQFGDPLPGVNVTFTASSGTQPTPATKQTDDAGQASPTSWTLPTTSGTVTVTASVSGTTLTAVPFTVTLTPGAASSAVVNPATSSNAQSATAGQAVAVPPSVLVRDQYNNPVPGVNVTFAVTGGGGAVVPTTAIATNAQGLATVTSWTLGTALGANALRATVAGVTTPVDFTATGVAGTPTSIVVGGTGNSQGQTAVANTNVANAPVVLVRDAGNNPVAGVVVRFTIGGGAGKILTGATDNTGQNTIDVTTGANGQAAIFAWRLGSVGSNTLNASLPAHPTVSTFVFNATGTVGPPTQLAIVNQAWATTQASTPHAGNPSVIVQDAGGNNVSGATIVWTAGGSSTLSAAASSTSNASGVALFPRSTVNWTAGADVGGSMSLVATVQGTTLTRTFTSQIVGAPASLVKTAGDNQTGAISAAVSTRPAVRVVDGSNNPVPGVSVTFAVTAGGGSVSGTPAITDSLGIATVGSWTLGGAVGSSNNTLRASLTATPTTFVDFTASATAGPPASMTAKAGNPTSGDVNSTQTVTVVVRDAGSNLVQGASVTFSVINTPGNAAIIGTNPVTTNASGEASVQVRLDTLARTNTIQAVTPGATGSVGVQMSIVGTPLAGTKIVISAGNNQTGTASSPLAVQPQVKVSDVYNNPVPSIGVTFAAAQGTVNCGGGAAASCATTSNSGGIAATTWTMSASGGTHTLNAYITSIPGSPVAFTATVATCSTVAYTLGTTVNGSIANTDCNVSGSYYDPYSITLGGATFFSYTYSPTTAYEPMLSTLFWPNAGGTFLTTIAPSGQAITRYALLPAGAYSVRMGTQSAGVTGNYSLTSQVNPTVSINQCDFFAAKGVTHNSTLDATSTCSYRSTNAETGIDRSYRLYYILLGAGETMTLTMSGTLDNYLELYLLGGTRTFVTARDNFATNSSPEVLTYQNTSGSTQYLEIRATHYVTGSDATRKTGSYSLQIQ